MNSDAEQELEDARERAFWRRIIQGLVSLLIVGALVAVLWTLTVVFEWQRYFLLTLLGLLAGLSIAVALGGSRRERSLTGLVVGGITLPSLAAYLGATAGRDPDRLSANSASFLPFLAGASVALLGAVWITNLWRPKPTPPAKESDEAPELAHGEGALP
jgi:hypothetical protein